MSHALARNALHFSIARFALGLGEAANFPAAMKTTADWFPPKERALATGIFNSGSNIGAVVAPLAVPWIAVTWGWRAAFLITGALGFVWVLTWLLFYSQPRESKRITPEELALIESGRDAHEGTEKIAYWTLLTQRQAWAFLIGKFLTDSVWWFYLYWLPGFLNSKYGIDMNAYRSPINRCICLGRYWLNRRRLAILPLAGDGLECKPCA